MVASLNLVIQVLAYSSPTTTPTRMTNIGYAGQGYDIVKGNPLSTAAAGFDPGFLGTNNIIDLTYTSGKTTPDGRYLVPDSLAMESVVACSLVSSTTSIHSAYDYQQSLAIDASVDAFFGAWFAKAQFTASADFRRMSETVNLGESTVYSTEAACSVYQAHTLPFTKLPLTTIFLNAVAYLPATYNAASYLNVVKYFGTHYVTAMQMGAKMVRNLQCSSSDVATLTFHGVNVHAAVEVDSLLAHVQAGTDVQWHKNDYDQLKKMSCAASEVNIGVAPPTGLACPSDNCTPNSLNMQPWQDELLSDTGEPVPIQYTLASIDSLLTSVYFPDDKDIAQKQLNMQLFLQNDYCDRVPNCAPPNPTGTWLPEPPPPSSGRVSAAAVGMGSSLYVLGGGHDARAGNLNANVDVFHLGEDAIKWVASPAIPPMLTPRCNLSAASQGKFLYAFGGEANGKELATTEQLNLIANTWSARQPMPTPQASFATVATSDGMIIAMGGRSSGNVSAAVHVYDPDGNSWSPLPQLHVAREGLCAVVIEGVVYVAGGFNGSFLRTLESWDGTSWTLQPPMAYARSGAACAAVDGMFVVYGGLNGQGVVDVVEAYVPTQNAWVKRARGIQPLWLGAAATLIDQSEGVAKMFVVGGTMSPTSCAGAVQFKLQLFHPMLPTLSHDGSIVYVSSDGSLRAIDAVSGTKKWSFQTLDYDLSPPMLSLDGSIVYVMLGSTSLYAVDAVSGTKKWSFQTQDYDLSSPMLSPDGSIMLVVLKTSRDAIDAVSGLYAIDAVSGTSKWRLPTLDYSLSSPALSPDGSVVFVVLGTSLYAIDAVSGTKKWSFQTLDYGASSSASPTLSPDGSIVYCVLEGSSDAGSGDVGSGEGGDCSLHGKFCVYAINALSGAEKWSFPVILEGFSLSPDGLAMYVYSRDGFLSAIDTVSGTKKWSFTGSGLSDVMLSPVLGSGLSDVMLSPDGLLVLVKEDFDYGKTVLLAIHASSGTHKWVMPFDDCPYQSSDVVFSSDGSTMYFPFCSYMVAIDLVGGTRKWSFPTGESTARPSLSPDGSILYFGNTGYDDYDNNLFAIDAVSGTQKWSFPTDVCVTSVQVFSPDGSLYVTSRNTLYAVCVGQPTSTMMASFSP